jgi:hypothetical protein
MKALSQYEKLKESVPVILLRTVAPDNGISLSPAANGR